MPSVKRLVAVGVAALVIGLVATFPARIAYQWLAPSGFALSGISGSVWNGAATEGSAGGLYFSEITWQFRPLALFGLEAGYAISSRLPSGFIESGVSFGPGGGIRLDDLAAAMSLGYLAPLLPLAGVEGDIGAQFDRLTFAGGYPVEAEGSVTVSSLLLRVLAPSPLGDFRAVFRTEADVISAVVEDIAGVLDVNGNLVLQNDRSYSFVGQVAPTADTPAAVVEELRFLGSPDAQGRREFRFEGSL